MTATQQLELYHQRRTLSPKRPMDDNTQSTLDESCSSAAGDDIFNMSYSGLLPDESHHSRPSNEEHEFMPTFNAMVARSNCQDTENISAIGVIEKEKETARKNSQRASVLVQHFMEDRLDTFSRNLDFVHQEAEDLKRSFVSRRSTLSRPSLASTAVTSGTLGSIAESDVVGMEVHEEDQKSRAQKRLSLMSMDTMGSISEADVPDSDSDEEPVDEKDSDPKQRGKSISEFVEDRKNTFTRNVDFLRGQADSWFKSFQN